MANPNRVRALIGAFAQANHTHLNRLDGLGYDFVADIVLKLDPKNPQVAARIMGAFRSSARARSTAARARRGDAAARCGNVKFVARTCTTSSPVRWPIVDLNCLSTDRP